MEEQKRYKVYKDNRENSYICDTSKNVDYKTYQEFVDLLNQQDKRIKELGQENKELKDYTENTANLIDKLTEDSVSASKQLAIEELEKLKATDFQKIIFYSFTPSTHIENLIDDRIKSLKGGGNNG